MPFTSHFEVVNVRYHNFFFVIDLPGSSHDPPLPSLVSRCFGIWVARMIQEPGVWADPEVLNFAFIREAETDHCFDQQLNSFPARCPDQMIQLCRSRFIKLRTASLRKFLQLHRIIFVEISERVNGVVDRWSPGLINAPVDSKQWHFR